MPPSGSVADATQVSLPEVVTPVSGVTSTLVIVGLVFSTVTLSESFALPPSASVAMALQVMVSPGLELEEVNCRVLLFPILEPAASNQS